MSDDEILQEIVFILRKYKLGDEIEFQKKIGVRGGFNKVKPQFIWENNPY